LRIVSNRGAAGEKSAASSPVVKIRHKLPLSYILPTASFPEAPTISRIPQSFKTFLKIFRLPQNQERFRAEPIDFWQKKLFLRRIGSVCLRK